MATAIGNGITNRMIMDFNVFQRMESTRGSFYNDPWLDPLAKAVYPRVAEALQAGEQLNSDAFVRDYINLAQEALGDDLQSPVPLLRVMGAAYEAELSESMQYFQRSLRIGSSWGANGLDAKARSTFQNFKDLSGIVLLRQQNLHYLDDWSELLGNQVIKTIKTRAQQGNLVYGIKRSESSYIFVFIAPDAAAMRPLIDGFARQKKRFEGLMPN